MPLTGPASYLPTMDSFIAHWTSANAALGGGAGIALGGGVTVENLSEMRENLQDQRSEVESARNGVELARAQIETLKAALLERLNQFNLKLASTDPDSPYMSLRPKAYSQSEGMGKVLQPLDDLADLWQRYNAASTGDPITLMGGYTLTTFMTERGLLQAAYPAWSAAQNGLMLARSQRTEMEGQIRTVLVQYRQRIPAEFAEGSAILASLPRLSPPEGSTPEAAVLSGTWDATTQTVDLAWAPITDESVTTLQIRGTTGPDYESDDESVIATFPANAPATWTGTWGLTAPGSSATFKLYAQTEQGNERGSNAVTVTRPVG